MSLRLKLWLVGMAWCAVFVASYAAALAADTRSELNDLFDVAVQSTPTAQSALNKVYEKLKRGDAADVRIDYAYALALVRQHRYRDALPPLARYLDKNRDDLSARTTKLWIQIQDKKFADAMQDMVALGGRVAAEPALEQRTAIAHNLGMLFGFLEIALTQKKDVDLRIARRRETIAKLPEECLEAFDAGQRDAGVRFDGLDAERRSLQQSAQSASKQSAEKDRQAAEQHLKRAADEQENMQQSAEQLREAQRAFNVVRQQLTSLAQDKARLVTQYALIEAQFTQAMQPQTIDRRNTTPAQAPAVPLPAGMEWRTTLPQQTQTTLQQIDRRDPRYAIVNQIAMSMAGLNKQGFDLDKRILELQTKAEELMGRGAEEAEALDQSEANATKAESKAKALEKRSQQAAPKSSPRATQIATQMKSLATYVPFPFEAERQRVLAWFAE